MKPGWIWGSCLFPCPEGKLHCMSTITRAILLAIHLIAMSFGVYYAVDKLSEPIYPELFAAICLLIVTGWILFIVHLAHFIHHLKNQKDDLDS